LHNVVYDVVQQVFNGQMERGFNRSLAIDLFSTAKITDRIMEGQQASDKAQSESNMRLGYMGHLTLIAEEVVKFAERIPPESFSQLVLDTVTTPEWIDYVEHTLAETRERDNAILGGVRPDVSLGPRQAVLNAVGASQVIGGLGGSLAGLTGGSNLMENVELTGNANAAGSAGSNTGYLFSGSSLMSGFSHGSSDEEDEDMEDGELERRSSIIDDSDQVGEVSFDDTDMSY
jgi:SIT4-associating protein SAP185/190